MAFDKFDGAIERLKLASETSIRYYQQPLMVTYSGGKDSDVLLDLALRAQIPIEVVHNHTTADAPQTVQYVRRRLHSLELQGIKASITYPMYKGSRVSLWSLMSYMGPPTRRLRWCCRICKEQSGEHRVIATGVRWAESTRRKAYGPVEALGRTNQALVLLPDIADDAEQLALSDVLILSADNDDRRRWVEHCQMRGEIIYNPIIDWSDRDVWDYLAGHEVNPLYQMGFDRVGCIGCPQAGKRRNHHFEVFPPYARMWRRALERYLNYRQMRGMRCMDMFVDIDHLWSWLMERNIDQLVLPGFL